MEEIFKHHIEKAKAEFLNQVELMKPTLYSRDRVVFENFVIAYDNMFNALTEANKISSNSVLCDSLPADLKREIEIHIETTKECIENFGIPTYVKELLEQDIKMYEKILARCKAGNVA
jgi:hypothetical protein